MQTLCGGEIEWGIFRERKGGFVVCCVMGRERKGDGDGGEGIY